MELSGLIEIAFDWVVAWSWDVNSFNHLTSLGSSNRSFDVVALMILDFGFVSLRSDSSSLVLFVGDDFAFRLLDNKAWDVMNGVDVVGGWAWWEVRSTL